MVAVAGPGNQLASGAAVRRGPGYRARIRNPLIWVARRTATVHPSAQLGARASIDPAPCGGDAGHRPIPGRERRGDQPDRRNRPLTPEAGLSQTGVPAPGTISCAACFRWTACPVPGTDARRAPTAPAAPHLRSVTPVFRNPPWVHNRGHGPLPSLSARTSPFSPPAPRSLWRRAGKARRSVPIPPRRWSSTPATDRRRARGWRRPSLCACGLRVSPARAQRRHGGLRGDSGRRIAAVVERGERRQRHRVAGTVDDGRARSAGVERECPRR